jgi:RimJ/RimL family protein N-acetyltransferase
MFIHIEPFTEDDIAQLIKWIDKPGASNLWASRTYIYPLSRETVLLQMEKTKLHPQKLMIFKIVNHFKQTVGHVELDQVNNESQSVRISRFFIDPSFRG